MTKPMLTTVAAQPLVAEVREDAWVNPHSGMGVPGVDPRPGWMPYARQRDQDGMRNLWVGDGIAGRIVEHPADEMTRAGGKVTLGQDMTTQEAALHSQMDELAVWSKYARVLKFDRGYGGGGLVMALDDGMDWALPVDTSLLERVSAIHVATPDELRAVRYFKDPTRTDMGLPAVYEWRPATLSGVVYRVHASRVVAFRGIEVDGIRTLQNDGWGDSVLARCEERIRDTASSLAGLGVALQNFSQDVISTDAAADYQASKAGRAELEKRMAAFRVTKSMLGVWLLGKGEAYARHAISMAGVADVMHELAAFLCAVSGMPMAVLMGYAEAGLGDAARSQRAIWHDTVDSWRESRLRPAMNTLIRLMLLAKSGPTGGVEPKDWKLEFGQLAKPTQADEDARKKLHADIDNIYLTHQALRPEWVARHRFSGPDGFNPNLPPDPYMTADVPPYQEPEPARGGEPLTPEPPQALSAEGAPEEAAVPTESGSVADTALNGAQITGLFEGLKLAATGQLPRETVVQALALALNRPVDRLEPVVGALGAGFVPREEAPPAAPPARADSAERYAALLLAELQHGGLSEEEVLGKVGKLYGVPARQARALVKKLGKPRLDAAGLTHFPRQGENKRVALKSSRFEVFDPAYAVDLKENWPEVWGLSSNPLGAKQFDRLLPLARAGGVADSDMEAHAVRLREEWARRNAKKERAAGVVAQVKQLVVGRLGESGMKRVLEAAKEKARRARETKGRTPTA